MRSFDYHRPTAVDQAVALVAGEARPLAGGMSLIPSMKLRLAAPSALVDLSAIAGLSKIDLKGKTLTIGAMSTHDAVSRSETVRSAIPALAALAGMIGDPQVRNRGTIGGSLANNDPTADYPAAVLALGATIVTDRREIAAGVYFKGMFETALAPGELIVAVRFPLPEKAGYAKLPNPASRFAITGVFVAAFNNAVRVAVTGAGPGVFRATLIEDALKADFSPKAIERIVIDPAPLSSDIHADAEYRAHLTTVMAQRAVMAALSYLRTSK
jgi:aerobic carbon-monoxide dehydrogenase medium subunit